MLVIAHVYVLRFVEVQLVCSPEDAARRLTVRCCEHCVEPLVSPSLEIGF